MAYMIPEPIPKKATLGEKLLFSTFKEHLPEDYIVYYEPNINGRRPDYVIIGPNLGVLVLEVKDYTENTLYQLNSDEWWIRTKIGQLEKVSNPYKQAREYAFLVSNKLKKDKNLLQSDYLFKGYLKFQYGFGVVFTRMKQTHLVKNELYRIISPEFILTREEIDPNDEMFSSEHLLDKMLGMFLIRKNYMLTEEDINTIRYHLFPEVRISGEIKETVYYNDQVLLSLHNIKAMDLHQELLAKQLGDKHRLIRGVAGSGKTLILASRAKLLAQQYSNWRILVLCYGVPLSRTLKNMIDQNNVSEGLSSSILYETNEQIKVSTFHEWLKNDFKINNDKEIPELLEKIEGGELSIPQFEAILIDEGQDFEESWLKLVSATLNPDTQSLLLVEDKAQDIYKRRTSISKKVGLDFRGRSKVLNINYRNTAEIVSFSWDFYCQYSELQHKINEEVQEGIEIIPPQSTKRKGPKPQIRSFPFFHDEVEWISKIIKKLNSERNISYSDMAILYRVKRSKGTPCIQLIKQELLKNNIPIYWITEDSESKREYNPEDNSIKLSTLDSAKGLDFRVVFIVNIDSLPFYLEESEAIEASRLYIGMTRSTEWLFLSYSGQSKFTKYLDTYINV